MGYNTAVLVLNDYLSDIETDQAFGAKVAEATIQAHARMERVNILGTGVQVLPSEHADWTQIVLIGQNRIRRAATANGGSEEDVLREWAWQLGYDLRKRKVGPTPQ